MKLSSTLIVASLVVATTDAFGIQNRKGQMSMRTNTYDLVRRQKFNNILSTVKENPSKEVVETVLLSSDTNDLIVKCNWKLRKAMIRKVNDLAAEFDGVVADDFGVP
jgi:hypothetical protein